MSNVYVVGASGYIGQSLTDRLIKSELNVYTVGRSSSDDFSLDLLSNKSDFHQKIKKNDYVYFLAAVSSPDFCNNNYEEAYKVNVTNTINQIELLISKGARVIFSSSDVVYGGTTKCCDESTKKTPLGLYAEMKNEVETHFSSESNFKVVRFSYVLGVNDKFYSLLKESNGKEIEIFSGFKRNLVSLDDVVLGLANLVNKWELFLDIGEINFCGEELISRENIAQQYKKDIDNNLNFCVVDAPDGFWKSRSQVIEMKSNYFTSLLGKKTERLDEIFKGLKYE